MSRAPRRDLRIEECWLYAIASPADLARRLSSRGFVLTTKEIEQLSKDAGNFKLFAIKKSNGKMRAIQEPKPKLQRAHRRIHELLSRVQVPTYLHSAVRGKSYLSNAHAHALGVAVIKIDVKEFFASVPRDAVLRFFRKTMKCRQDVAGLLADLLTFDAHLPTGSSASPIIAYYAFKPMFDEIERLAKVHSLIMTCYVDDMALSGSAAVKSTLFETRKIIARFGLKSHKAHIFSLADPKVITGVCLTSDGNRVPNKLHLKIKQGFDAVSNAVTLEAKSKASISLLGRLEAAGQIDPTFKARAATLRSGLRIARQAVDD
jgi:hypothetical protein